MLEIKEIDKTTSFEPSKEFQATANIRGEIEYNRLCREAEEDFEGFWRKIANELVTWQEPFSKVLDESNAPFYKWFIGGKLNLSYNCIDRHLKTKGNQAAIIFEGDREGESYVLTYNQLYERVCRMANGLKSLGIKKGDRVVIYMPMIPETVIAMQACARIGAIHCVVFGGFSAGALKDRLQDVRAKVIITADETRRGGKTVPLKDTVDEILFEGHCTFVEHVIMFEHTHARTSWLKKRDIAWSDLNRNQLSFCEPEWLDAEDVSFILYTSGSTGKPKGVQHSVGGYLVGALNTMRWVFDIREGDVFWCTADVGWITGHTYVGYGPLAIGTTQVMFEGIPTYPDAGRFWKIIETHKVSVFYTAPTAIRLLIKQGEDLPNEYDLSSLRLLGSVGEPINPSAWRWYYDVIGGGRCPIVDTWWQTETGSHVIAPIPGAVRIKPGSCSLPIPGAMIDVVDDQGNPVEQGQSGYLVLTRPIPSLLRTIWGNNDRFINGYYPEKFKHKLYLAGDSASIDEEGFVWIGGRVDDVLNVSGHRMGTMEIESAIAAHKSVAEVAVVGRPDQLKGEAVVAFVVPKGNIPETPQEIKELVSSIKNWVGHEIGNIAKPSEIRFGSGLPKTRSGKIMRRLLRSLANSEEIKQDVSTLENPDVLNQFQKVF